jgi:TRAP-type C4-dicarboxylate transport system permease small subunit
MSQFLLNLLSKISYIAEIIRKIMVSLMCFYFLLVILQVIFRYVLNASLFWAEEVVRYSMIWSVMLGSALLAYESAHIRIDLIDHTLSKNLLKYIYITCDILLILFAILLLLSGIKFVERTFMQKSASLDVPMWFVYVAIPISAFLHILFVIAKMIKNNSSIQSNITE